MGILSKVAERAGDLAKGAGSTVGRMMSGAYDGFTGAFDADDMDHPDDVLEKARRSGLTLPTSTKIQVPGPGGLVEFDPEDWATMGANVTPAQMPTPGPANKLTYAMLAEITQTWPAAVIINRRCSEIGEMAEPISSGRSLGWQFRLREEKRSPTQIEQKEIDGAERFMQNCGGYDDAAMRGRHDFAAFLKMYTRDSMSYDQGCFEVLLDRYHSKVVAGFQVYDGSSIRRTIKSRRQGKESAAYDYVQINHRQEVVAAWPASRFCFGIRRPRTNLAAMGYGYPESEELYDILTYLLWGVQANAARFKQGIMADGILSVVGENMTPQQRRGFKRQFRAMMVGVANAARVPFINLPNPQAKIQWQPFNRDNKSMQHKEWMDFLIKVWCALYLADPIVMGIQYGTEGQKSALEGSGPETRHQISRDIGLRPHLRHMSTQLNKYVVWPRWPWLQFEFYGLDELSDSEKLDLDIKAVTHIETVDEVRARRNLPPRPGGDGNVILNQIWLQAKQPEPRQHLAEEFGESGQPEPTAKSGENGQAESQVLDDDVDDEANDKTQKALPVPSFRRNVYEVGRLVGDDMGVEVIRYEPAGKEARNAD